MTNTNMKRYSTLFLLQEHANANLNNKIPLHTYAMTQKTHNIRCWPECNWNSQRYVVQHKGIIAIIL